MLLPYSTVIGLSIEWGWELQSPLDLIVFLVSVIFLVSKDLKGEGMETPYPGSPPCLGRGEIEGIK